MYEFVPESSSLNSLFDFILLDPEGIAGLNNRTYYPFVGEDSTNQSVYSNLQSTRNGGVTWSYNSDTNVICCMDDDSTWNYVKAGQVKVYKEEFVPAFSYTDASSFKEYREITCFERVPKLYTNIDNTIFVFIPSELSPPAFNKSNVMISGSLPSISYDYGIVYETLEQGDYLLSLIKPPTSDEEEENLVIYESKTLSFSNAGTFIDRVFMPELELPEEF